MQIEIVSTPCEWDGYQQEVLAALTHIIINDIKYAFISSVLKAELLGFVYFSGDNRVA